MKQIFSLALVTGAGGGIGRAIAKELDRRGWALILVGRRFSTLEETADLLSKRPLCIEADLSDPVQCERVFEQVKTMPVDLLVNNAGFGLCGDFTETDEAREFSMLDLNVRAIFHQAVRPAVCRERLRYGFKCCILGGVSTGYGNGGILCDESVYSPFKRGHFRRA